MTVSSERVALVTGANRGIGLGVVRLLAARGFTTILGSRDRAKGEDVARPLAEGGLRVIPRQLDVTDQESIDRLKTWIEEQFGRLDALVNNAAIIYDSWQRAAEADLNTVREAFETNTLGAWRMCRAFIFAGWRNALTGIAMHSCAFAGRGLLELSAMITWAQLGAANGADAMTGAVRPAGARLFPPGGGAFLV